MSASGPEKTSGYPEPSRPKDPQQVTTIGSYALAIARALEYGGVDSARIFRAANIPLAASNDPMSRLPLADLTRLFRACVDVTNNPYFGLSVARFMHPSNLHALGYALAASATLMDYCRRLERYFRLASQAAVIKLSESEGELTLRWELLADICGETEDAFLAFVVLSMRQLYLPSFNPVRVAFHHPMPRDGAGPYESFFRAPVGFDTPAPLLLFQKADLEQPLAGDCPELAQLNDGISTKYIAKLDKNDVITAVRQKIIEYLPTGDCTREKVASAMCLSPTTLQLKLSQRNTSFHDLLDDTRKELARSYVQQPLRSITEITFLLGFSDTSNFTRAFKRWTGQSPTQFRDHD